MLISGTISAIAVDKESGLPITESEVPAQATINEQLLDAAFAGNHNKLIKALNDGADINYAAYNGVTALHRAAGGYSANIKILKSLINRGANLELVDNEGETALHWAVTLLEPKLEAVEILLQAGAPINAKNKKGETALFVAADRSRPDVAKILLKKRAGTPTSDGLAIINEEIDVNALDDQGWSPLHIAAYRGNKEIIQILIGGGADFELKTPQGSTALRLAVEWGNINALKVLVEAGADINTRNDNGYTPLHGVASNGKLEMVKALIELGADISPLNRKRTPLTEAIDQGHNDIAELLVKAGANKDYRHWFAAAINVLDAHRHIAFLTAATVAAAIIVPLWVKAYRDNQRNKALQMKFPRLFDQNISQFQRSIELQKLTSGI